MAYHIPDTELTNEWQDLIALYPEIQGLTITLQAKFVGEAYVFCGTNYTPGDDDPAGSLLRTGDSITGTSPRWLVKGKGSVSIFVED